MDRGQPAARHDARPRAAKLATILRVASRLRDALQARVPAGRHRDSRRGRSSTSRARRFAVFARQLVTRASPFDRWNAGRGKISADAEAGVALFVGKAGCIRLPLRRNLSDGLFHNVSTSPPREDGTRADEGRARVTGDPADGGKFLTPTLRQVVTTSPYFHDGGRATLSDVLEHLNTKAGDDPNHDPIVGQPLGLTAQEKFPALPVHEDALEPARRRPRADRQALRRRRDRGASRRTCRSDVARGRVAARAPDDRPLHDAAVVARGRRPRARAPRLPLDQPRVDEARRVRAPSARSRC
jgi:hypothetical protein